MKIHRDSILSAKEILTSFIPNQTVRESVIDFLVTAIELANSINESNWNINLDSNGKFIRFNVGHVYCIEINKERTLILCNKDTLRDELIHKMLILHIVDIEIEKQ